MSSIIYFLVEQYPWWGIPLAFLLVEIGNYFRRSGKRGKFFQCMIGAALLFGLTGFYFWVGYGNVTKQMQQLERRYGGR